MTEILSGRIVLERIGDISILLIDYDSASVASLTSMLEQFSEKVMSVDAASKALLMIEKQKDIGLVIANIEMPHIDSHSFLTALFHKDIPLILINPEIKTKQISDHLKKGARFFLNKPISENDIKNMWQHVLPKKSQELKKTNVAGVQENVTDTNMKQIAAFRESLKRQRTSQASLLGKRPFIKTFLTSETYPKRSMTDVEWKTKSDVPIEVENKRGKGKKIENNGGRRCNLWTNERHMKFLAAISILGEKNLRPISILRIINDPNLTHRQVASHLQKYKAQVKQMSDTLPRKEWKSTDKTFEYPSDYEYPFNASNLTKNLIASNSLWYSLRERIFSSSSIPQFSFEKPASEGESEMPKLQLGGKLDLSNHSQFGNVLNKSSMDVNIVPSATSINPPYNIPSTDHADHIGLVSTGLSSDNLPVLSGLPSSVSPSNEDALQNESTRICTPQSDPNPFQPPSSILDLTSTPDSFVHLADQCTMEGSYNFLPEYTMNPFETNIDQMDWVPSTENYTHHEINMNHMDWIPSTESYALPETGMNIVPETNTNQMGWGSLGEGYVPSEIDINQMCMVSSGVSFHPQDEINKSHVGFISCEVSCEIPPKTNTNQLDWFFPEASYVPPGNITSMETNTTQMALVHSEISYADLDNMVPLATNMEEMNYVPYKEGYDVPIEDLISFDFDAGEMDLPSWLENYGISEIDNLLSTSYPGHDFAFSDPMESTPHMTMEGHHHSLAMNSESTSQQHDMMEFSEYQNIEALNQREGMDWIEEIMNTDA